MLRLLNRIQVSFTSALYRSRLNEENGTAIIGAAITINLALLTVGGISLLNSYMDQRELINATKAEFAVQANKNAIVVMKKIIDTGLIVSRSGTWSPASTGVSNSLWSPLSDATNTHGSFNLIHCDLPVIEALAANKPGVNLSSCTTVESRANFGTVVNSQQPIHFSIDYGGHTNSITISRAGAAPRTPFIQITVNGGITDVTGPASLTYGTPYKVGWVSRNLLTTNISIPVSSNTLHDLGDDDDFILIHRYTDTVGSRGYFAKDQVADILPLDSSYKYASSPFIIFVNPTGAHTLALYRCKSTTISTSVFLTASPICLGKSGFNAELMGYVYPSAETNTETLSSYGNAAGTIFGAATSGDTSLKTKMTSAAGGNLVVQESLGYVLPYSQSVESATTSSVTIRATGKNGTTTVVASADITVDMIPGAKESCLVWNQTSNGGGGGRNIKYLYIPQPSRTSFQWGYSSPLINGDGMCYWPADSSGANKPMLPGWIGRSISLGTATYINGGDPACRFSAEGASFASKTLNWKANTYALRGADNSYTSGDCRYVSRDSSPLIITLDDKPLTLTDSYNGVLFDLMGEGLKQRFPWPNVPTQHPFVVLPKNGRVENINQLFGNNTLGPDGTRAENGFEALKKYDLNRDNWIDSKDSVYAQLRLWRDLNINGISEENELTTLISNDLTSIDLAYLELVEELNPLHTNDATKQRSVVIMKDGSLRKIYDLWVIPSDVAEADRNLSSVAE